MRALMLMGVYAGQIIVVDDLYAAQGVIDGWCRDTNGLKYPFNSSGMIVKVPRSLLPASYLAWATAGYPAGGEVAPPLPLQIIATRGTFPGNETDGPTTPAVHTRGDFRQAVKTAPVDATDIRIVYDNFKKTGTGPEQNGFNDVTVDAALEYGAANYRADFAGSVTKLIAPGDAAQMASVPPLASLPARSSLYIRTSIAVAALNLKWARATKSKSGLDVAVENASTSQAGGTGALGTGGGTARTISYAATALLGRPASPTPGVFILGDSNAYGFGTSGDADGLYGVIAQGLKASNGDFLAFANASRSGDLLQYCLPSDNPRQWAMIDYATCGVIMLGTNSVATNTTAQMLAHLDIIAAAMKARTKRGKAYAYTIPPRTDSGNTAILSGYETKPGQFNDAIIAKVGTTLDGVIDPNEGKVYMPGGVVLTSGAGGIMVPATRLWISATYTSDGTHYSDAGVAVGKDTTRLWAQTLT
jgi:hypothetical protein